MGIQSRTVWGRCGGLVLLLAACVVDELPRHDAGVEAEIGFRDEPAQTNCGCPDGSPWIVNDEDGFLSCTLLQDNCQPTPPRCEEQLGCEVQCNHYAMVMDESGSIFWEEELREPHWESCEETSWFLCEPGVCSYHWICNGESAGTPLRMPCRANFADQTCGCDSPGDLGLPEYEGCTIEVTDTCPGEIQW